MTDESAPSLLASYQGARPSAPAWFNQAVGLLPERRAVEVEGAAIEMLTWGRVGAPGLLLLHGGMAHADWWSFIAPYFASTHRVAALSWSGMGGSGWRASYDMDQYVREMFAVIEAAGLRAGATKPMVLAHSFGGFPTMRAARMRGVDLGGVMILDAPVLPPAEREQRSAQRKDRQKPPRETRIYRSETEALARFRFSPPQVCDHTYIVDWIARHSLREVKSEAGMSGWTWKFDPFMWTRLERSDANEDLARAACRVAMIWGAKSSLFAPATVDYVRATAPAGSRFLEIPEAAHHVMADQPLALVAAVRGLMEGWR